MSNPEAAPSEPQLGETTEDIAQKAKALVTQIFNNRYSLGEMPAVEDPLRAQLDAMPREALILVAWQGIADYHRELTIWGDTPRTQRLLEEKDYRKSLLTAEEIEQAVNLANNWLDDNFDK